MKFMEVVMYASAWGFSFADVSTNTILGFIAAGLIWKCVGDSK